MSNTQSIGPRRRALHRLAIVVLVAGEPDRLHPRAEAADEVGQDLLVAAGRHHAGRAHRERDGDGGAAEIAGGPAHQHGLARLAGLRRESRHRAPAAVPSAHHCEASSDVIAPRRFTFSVGTRICSAYEPWRKCCCRRMPPGPAAREPLQGDVGRHDIVARSHRRVAEHPVADAELGRVRADRAHPADAAGARDDRQVERIVALAAEDLVHVGQDARGDDVDDDLAGAEHRIGGILDHQRRSEGFEYGSFHDVHLRDG